MLTPTPSQIDLWCKCNTLLAELKVRYGVEQKMQSIYSDTLLLDYIVLLNVADDMKDFTAFWKMNQELGIIPFGGRNRRYRRTI